MGLLSCHWPGSGSLGYGFVDSRNLEKEFGPSFRGIVGHLWVKQIPKKIPREHHKCSGYTVRGTPKCPERVMGRIFRRCPLLPFVLRLLGDLVKQWWFTTFFWHFKSGVIVGTFIQVTSDDTHSNDFYFG